MDQVAQDLFSDLGSDEDVVMAKGRRQHVAFLQQQGHALASLTTTAP